MIPGCEVMHMIDWRCVTGCAVHLLIRLFNDFGLGMHALQKGRHLPYEGRNAVFLTEN